MTARWAAAAVALHLIMATSAQAEDTQTYARVIVDTSVLRSGPSSAYRVVYIAERGEAFPVQQRGPEGYWFRVALPDGTSAWILGATVYNQEAPAEDGGFMSSIFAPPPLMQATGEVAVSFGILNNGGFMAVRPSLLLSPNFGFEATAAASVARGGRILIGGLGGILNVFPNAPIVPFVVVGGGFAVSDPNADSFLLESGTVGMFYGGGGIRIGFKYRITLRLETRAYVFIEPDRYVNQQEFSGGLSVFF